VKNVSHQNDVRFRKGISEKVATNKPDPARESVLSYIFLKDRTDLGQIESNSGQMRMLQSNLRDKIALRGPDPQTSRNFPRETVEQSPGSPAG